MFNLADREGSNMVSPQVMDYSHKAAGMNTPEAYELLLDECMRGIQTLFTRWDFLENSWKIVDNLRARCGPLTFYKAGSIMPPHVKEMLGHDHASWNVRKK